MNITCIGHITRDKIVTPNLTTYMAGGTTTYVAMGLNNMLRNEEKSLSEIIDFRLIASLAEEDLDIIDEMRQQGISVDYVPSEHTSYFENIYGADSSDRRQCVRSIGDPFSIDKLKELLEPLRKEKERPYIILGSLLASDFPLDVVSYCREIGNVVMDAQGYFREVKFSEEGKDNKVGKVYECDWTNQDDFLKNITVLKLNENEARLITDLEDLHDAAWRLHKQGVSEVLLTLGRLGSIIAAEGKVIDIPVVPELQSIDATGCGDTYVMAYIYRRSQGDTPYEAAMYASSAATLKLEATGPLSATEQEVKARQLKG